MKFLLFQSSIDKNIGKASQKLPPGSYFSHTTNSSSSKNKQTNSTTIDTQQNQNQATLDTNLANLPTSPIYEQEITPKVSINHNMNHQNTLSQQQKQQMQDAEDIQDQIIDDEIIDEDDYLEDFVEGADNSKNLSKQQTERKNIPSTNLIIAEQKQIQGKQFEKTEIKKQETIKTNNNNQSYMDDSKTYLERNSILSGINDTSNVKNGGTGGQNDVDDQQYEEEDFEEEIID